MNIYEHMQEAKQKFKFSNNGVLYINTFEPKEVPHTKSNKPFSLWKIEEGKRISNKVKAEINKARTHGNRNSSFELRDGILKFVQGKPVPKEEKVEEVEELTEAEKYETMLVG